MKIFEYDFNSGKKLGCIDIFTHFGNGQRLGFYKKSGMEVLEYVFDEEDNKITADNYGKESICCCTGKIDGKWNWVVIPNKTLSEKDIERNRKQFGTDFYKI